MGSIQGHRKPPETQGALADTGGGNQRLDFHQDLYHKWCVVGVKGVEGIPITLYWSRTYISSSMVQWVRGENFNSPRNKLQKDQPHHDLAQ